MSFSGLINAKVKDPIVRTLLFDYDFGIDCPQEFFIEFYFPAEGPDSFYKEMILELTDSYRTINVTLIRPPPGQELVHRC